MGRDWAEGHVELLIAIIRKYEKLWNTKHPRFTSNKRIRHHFWKEITRIFNNSHKNEYTVCDVQTKWNYLRFKFQKERKKLCDLGENNSSWRYYGSLTFLTAHPIIKREVSFENRTKYSLRGKQESDDDTDVSIGSISPRNIRDENDDKRTYIAEKMNSEDKFVKSDEETDYVSIGSVSPPYCRFEENNQDFYT